jgi:hypothetical protein
MCERGTATSVQPRRRQLDLEYQDWARPSLQGRGLRLRVPLTLSARPFKFCHRVPVTVTPYSDGIYGPPPAGGTGSS